MRLSTCIVSLLLFSISSVECSFIAPFQKLLNSDDRRLVQISEFSEPFWVTENEKLEMKKQHINFMDVTNHANDHNLLSIDSINTSHQSYSFPNNLTYKVEIDEINNQFINVTEMYDFLLYFSSFHTRYYKSSYGKQSAEWLFTQIKEIIDVSGNKHARIRKFGHDFPQFSIIVTIPGSENPDKKVIVGSHQDSINLIMPNYLRAPGADDNGSGTTVCLETLKALLKAEFQPKNTLEFHFYAAEEGGLLGSQDVYAKIAANNEDIVSHLQNDMTGYIKNTLDEGLPPTVGIINDQTDSKLNFFLKMVIDEVCDFEWVDSLCGYGCSDHASATKYGYQSAFVFESDFELHNKYVHSTKDTIDRLDFNHMKDFVRMTVAYAYELGSTDF